MFKVGDKVKRTKYFNQSSHKFIENEVFKIVEFTRDGYIVLANVPSEWNPDRFELVESSIPKRNLPDWF